MNILTQTTPTDTKSRMLNVNTPIHADLPNGVKLITHDYNDVVAELTKPDWPLIDQFFWTYETSKLSAGNPKDDTKRKNVVAMRRILVRAGIDPAKCDIRHFAGSISNRCIAEWYVCTHNANDVRLARSMFSKRWIMFYRSQNIDTRPFANWVALPLQGIKVQKFDPNGNELNRIVDNCERLIVSDPMMWRMYALAYGFGLRSSEIKRARWGDLMEDTFDDNKLIRVHSPKSGGKWQDRPVDPAWWDKLFSHGGHDGELIVPVQEDRITREFPQFLRDVCGVVDLRPVHRLRKYCGHRVMRSNGNNAFVASRALGHSSVEMTQRVYVGNPRIAPSF
jgi:integrase